MGKRDFARFQLKMSFRRIYHIALGPRLRFLPMAEKDLHQWETTLLTCNIFPHQPRKYDIITLHVVRNNNNSNNNNKNTKKLNKTKNPTK